MEHAQGAAGARGPRSNDAKLKGDGQPLRVDQTNIS